MRAALSDGLLGSSLVGNRVSRILLVGSTRQGSLENAYFRALSRVGQDVSIYDLDTDRYFFRGSSLLVRALNNKVVAKLAGRRAESQFQRFLSGQGGRFEAIVVFKGAELSRGALDAARARAGEAIWINLNPDDPLNVASKGSTNRNILRALDFYDVYCTWTVSLVEKLLLHGCRRVEVIPFGYDVQFHRPPESGIAIQPGVVSFIGAWDKDREAALTSLREFDLRVYGLGWDRVHRRSSLRGRIIARNLYGNELAIAIANAAASINLLRPQNRNSHNMRSFEIPAVGGLMLVGRNAEHEAILPDGRACLMYEDMTELRERLRMAIADPKSSYAIRQEGAKRIAGHSYDERALRLMRIVGTMVAKA